MTILDLILAAASLAALVAFLAIIVIFVPSPDLIIVVGVVLLMAGFDFYRSTFGREPPS